MRDKHPMNSLQEQLHTLLKQAIIDSFSIDANDASPYLSTATNPEFGDFQANFAMRLAKVLKKKPRDIAETVVQQTPTSPLIESLSVAGPGFLNIRCK